MRCAPALVAALALASCDRGGAPPCVDGAVRDGGACVRPDATVKPDGDAEAPSDVPVARDVAVDTTPPVPWASGRWRIPWQQGPRVRPPACGPGEPMTNGIIGASAWGFCAGPGWITTSAYGGLMALGDGGTVWTTSTSTREDFIDLGCGGSALFAGVADSPNRASALVRFDDPWSDGEVLWSRGDLVPRDGFPGGVGRIAGSDQLVAFTVLEPGWGGFYIGGPHGEGIHQDLQATRELASLDVQSLQADGPHVVIEASGEVFLYTRSADGLGGIENLSHSAAAQISAWVSGRYVVWSDQRDTLPGDPLAVNNPEIYLYDLETRVLRRITHDPPERPVAQLQPRIEGDWIIWLDLRNAPQPSQPPGYSPGQPQEIYGYHIPTGREVPLVTGANFIDAATLADGVLWYSCAANRPVQFEGIYRMPMPPPPSSP